MAKSPAEDVTCLLQRFNHGEPAALDRLMQAVYDELRAIGRPVFNKGKITEEKTTESKP